MEEVTKNYKDITTLAEAVNGESVGEFLRCFSNIMNLASDADIEAV